MKVAISLSPVSVGKTTYAEAALHKTKHRPSAGCENQKWRTPHRLHDWNKHGCPEQRKQRRGKRADPCQEYTNQKTKKAVFHFGKQKWLPGRNLGKSCPLAPSLSIHPKMAALWLQGHGHPPSESSGRRSLDAPGHLTEIPLLFLPASPPSSPKKKPLHNYSVAIIVADG